MNSVTEQLGPQSLLTRVLMRERMLLMLFGLCLTGCMLLLIYLRDAAHASVGAAAVAKARLSVIRSSFGQVAGYVATELK